MQNFSVAEAAEQDLEKQMNAAEDKTKGADKPENERKRVAPTTKTKHDDAKKRPKPSSVRKPLPKPRMIEDVKKETEDPEDEETEPCPEPHLELEDAQPDSAELEEMISEDAGEGESEQDDDDIFNDEFALPAQRYGRDSLPEQVAKQAATVSKGILDSIPAEMSASLVFN